MSDEHVVCRFRVLSNCEVTLNADKSFTIRPSAVKEVGGNPPLVLTVQSGGSAMSLKDGIVCQEKDKTGSDKVDLVGTYVCNGGHLHDEKEGGRTMNEDHENADSTEKCISSRLPYLATLESGAAAFDREENVMRDSLDESLVDDFEISESELEPETQGRDSAITKESLGKK